MPLKIQTLTRGSADYPAMLKLREEVLRRPLGFNLTEKDVSRDENATLIAAFQNNEICGCVILNKSDENHATLRQMAVSDSVQGQGVGRQLVEYLEAEARSQGITKITLHARESAIPFYQKLGYTGTSSLHGHELLPTLHMDMEKTL